MTIVMLQIVSSLTDDSRGIIYKCNIFIIQATEHKSITDNFRSILEDSRSILDDTRSILDDSSSILDNLGV
jgi:hypothetical protein